MAFKAFKASRLLSASHMPPDTSSHFHLPFFKFATTDSISSGRPQSLGARGRLVSCSLELGLALLLG